MTVEVSGICRPATSPNPRAIHVCPHCPYMAVATTQPAAEAGLRDHLESARKSDYFLSLDTHAALG